MRPTFAWDDVTIIQAVSHDDADKKYKSYIKSYHDYKGGIIEEPNNPDKYLVYELTKDDILK